MSDGDVVGQVGTRLLFEDESCRVWLLDLEPGGVSDWHRHDHPYVFVVTRPGVVRTEYSDGGLELQDGDPIGAAQLRYPDAGHRLVNIGPTQYRNIIVELKEPTA